MNTTIYIVRHGESEANAKGILQGHKDFPLTTKGEEQAKILSQELKNIHFHAVFSSDLLRAKRTAEIIALERKLAVVTTQALRERYFGKLEGMYKKDRTPEIIKMFDDWNALSNEESLKYRPYDGETGEEMVGRLSTFLRELNIGYPGKTILIVSHGDVMRNFLVHLGWAHNYELRGKTISNTAYIKIETDGVEFFVKETFGITKNKGREFKL